MAVAAREPWWPEHDEIMRRAFPHNPTWKIAAVLGRSYTTVAQRATRLGLKKSPEFMASDLSGRVRRGKQDPRMRASQFPKGHVPANKGLRRPGWARGRMRETQFKKGERQGIAVKLYQPIGAERVSKDGYLERKVNDDLPLQARWRAVHLVRWEAIHGRIPAGHALVFRDGNKANTDPENMELVTRAELMRRNSYVTRYPKPVADLIRLRGAVNRQINKRTRK